MIKTRKFSKDDVKRFQDFSVETYGEENVVSIPEHIINKHLDNPDGPSDLITLEEDLQTTARILVQKRMRAVGDKHRLAINPVDLISRSKTPFASIRLYKSALVSEQDKKSYAYHSSNPNSDPLYSKILREPIVFKLNYKFFPLEAPKTMKLRFFLNVCINLYKILIKVALRILAIRSNIQIVRIDKFENIDLDEMNIDSTEHILLREATRLNWRFKDCPPETLYKRFLFRRNGKSVGYLIVRDVKVNDVYALSVVDFHVSDIDVASKAYVQNAVLKMGQKVNVIFILANDGNPTIKRIFSFPFMKIPKKYEPQSFPIYVPGNDSKLGLNSQSFFTLFDLDIL